MKIKEKILLCNPWIKKIKKEEMSGKSRREGPRRRGRARGGPQVGGLAPPSFRARGAATSTINQQVSKGGFRDKAKINEPTKQRGGNIPKFKAGFSIRPGAATSLLPGARKGLRL